MKIDPCLMGFFFIYQAVTLKIKDKTMVFSLSFLPSTSSLNISI